MEDECCKAEAGVERGGVSARHTPRARTRSEPATMQLAPTLTAVVPKGWHRAGKICTRSA